jgi:asparagine synthase (glutamine-hydrolysing)
MQFALETRAPLLDYRIVEFAINLNPNFKIKNGVQKYILKDVLYQYLPKEIFDRPKWGFSIPLNNWLKNDINYILEKYTSQQIVEKFNIFNYSKINELKNKYYAGETYLYNRLWLVIVLHKFLEKYTVA